MSTHLHERKRLSEIWLFYANIIGYIRLILIIASVFIANVAVHWNSFSWAILGFVCNYTGGWLLDWLDGPMARKYKQCTIFGAGFDWYCDLLAEIVLIFWAAELRLSITVWLLLVCAVELGSGFVDTNNVAIGYRWSEFAPKRGFSFRVLEIVYPNGHYSKYGTTLWILYSTWIFCHIILSHTPADYTYLAAILRGLSTVLIPAVFGYILHQVAYLVALVSGWKEPASGVVEYHND